MLVGVQIEKNGKLMGKRMVKCESKLREMEQLLLSVDNPLQFLCQVRYFILIVKFVGGKKVKKYNYR